MGKRKHTLSEQQAVGRRIRKARKASGISAQEVADFALIRRNHYYVLERGEAMPSTPTLSRIARVVGVSVDYLLTGRNGNGNGKRNGGES
jgi:transcriptional regulator with XRE-family HTH domain